MVTVIILSQPRISFCDSIFALFYLTSHMANSLKGPCLLSLEAFATQRILILKDLSTKLN